VTPCTLAPYSIEQILILLLLIILVDSKLD